ncbi:mechanosensitive ion channel [Phenylobacterium sp. LjRoot219]|uniref:mechanosensitive ion channel family protein n=1 Tax=Phenylobacterium sp. LjRoot219 TaxID=3342283 RepID=UPI003ED140EC
MPELPDLRGFVLFVIGRTPVTLGGVLAGFAVALVGFALARLAGIALRRLRTRARHGREALYIVEKVITYGLAILAVIAGLSTLGLNLSSLAVFAGALGVGLGLGLQGVVKEFVSGLLLIFDRVLNVGDYVELADGKRGLIQEIGPRAVHIRTNDNIDLIVPNSAFTAGPVINWTLHNRTSRIHIPFTVATDSDRRRVREVVVAAARGVPFTLPESDSHKTQVWLTGLGGDGLRFELVVWPTLEAVKRPAAMSAAYTWAIADALDAAGIEVPYPQRELRVRSIFGQEGDEALAALDLQPRAAKAHPAEPAGADNDAAEELSRPFADPEPDEPEDHARKV